MARLFDDGSTEYLSRAGAVVATDLVSMVCWFNCNDDSLAQKLMAVSDASFDDDHLGLMLRGHVDDTIIMFYASDGGAASAITTTAFTANVWHHTCGVVAASNDVRVYIDGGSKGTAAPGGQITWANVDTTCIGALVSNGTVEIPLSGAMAEAAMYNCALTDTDAALFHHRRLSPLLVRPQNLMAYWALRHGDNADWMGRYDVLPYNTPSDIASPPIVYPERDDPVWGLVLPRYRPQYFWPVVKAPFAALYGERGIMRGLARGAARGV